MSATPRDLLKPRPQRVHEVYQSVQLQAGQANSQYVSFGCKVQVDATNTKFDITTGEYVLGQSIVSFAGLSAQNVAAGAALSAGQAVFVLLELDGSGALTQTVGAITTGTPVLPALTASRIAVGYLSLTGAFTPGTTALVAGNCVTLAYDAGNVSPVGGF